MKRIIVSIALAFPLAANAGCKELGAAVENALKEAADIEMRGTMEPSEAAPLKTLRLQRIANQLATVNSNLMLMDRAKCPMPQDPVGSGDLNPYQYAASQCARQGGDPGSSVRENWKRTK